MAVQKRRIVYLSDEEWAKVTERSSAFGVTISAYLRKLIEWRQPGPLTPDEERRAAPFEKAEARAKVAPLVVAAVNFGQRNPYAEFHPAPKTKPKGK